MTKLAETSGKITESQLLATGFGAVTRLKVITDGSNKATVKLYDSLTATGKQIEESAVAGTGEYGGGNWIAFPKFGIGLYVDISGVNAAAIVEWING